MTTPDPDFAPKLAEKLIAALTLSIAKLILSQVPWQKLKVYLARAGQYFIQSLTFRTAGKGRNKLSDFGASVVFYLLAILATVEFACAIFMSFDADHPIAIWRRGAGLLVGLVMMIVARACHVEADDLRDRLSKKSRRLW
ncbi:hypothetical protein [Luteibacter sp. 9135]|uniref:hypothetical protein n=1 Tax=Luteibacter sp. 9135 TaxID=1500893 RepID=UPI00055FC173|nr:hypothetical protein [Luteibacter sp. 9135]